MSSPQRQLHFNAFLMSSGHHEAAWRLPESNPFANTDLGHWRELARIAERARFDSLFLADGPAVRANPEFRPASALEPTILLTALAAATSHIGLIATASTTYNEPYNLARRFASLDHVSGGRAGWNIVTTADTASARTALPSGLQVFADHVVPIFRRRGLFRTEYTGQTLREHYGLPRPGSLFTANRRGVPEPVT